MGLGRYGETPSPMGRAWKHVFDFGGLLIKKTARSSRSCDGPSWAASNTAIESFWRCLFVEISPFLGSIRAPIGVPGSPWGSQGRRWGVSGTSPGVPGTCPGLRGTSPGVPGACPGVPGTSPGVPGTSPGVPGPCPGVPGASPGVPWACPWDLRDPKGLRRPRHPQDPFHKDDSVI